MVLNRTHYVKSDRNVREIIRDNILVIGMMLVILFCLIICLCIILYILFPDLVEGIIVLILMLVIFFILFVVFPYLGFKIFFSGSSGKKKSEKMDDPGYSSVQRKKGLDGLRDDAVTKKAKYCTNCGDKYSSSDKFCRSCGKKLSGEMIVQEKPVSEIKKSSSWTPIQIIVGAIVVVIFFFMILGSLCILPSSNKSDLKTSQKNINSEQTQQKIFSHSFNDLGDDWCLDSTNDLKRENNFKVFKGQIVEWEGEVSSIGESWGSLTLQVKHCPNTLISDIIVTLKDSEKQKAIDLKEGQMVKYTAKLKRWGSWTGISADDGVILSSRRKGTSEDLNNNLDMCKKEYAATGDHQEYQRCLTLAQYS